MDSKGVAERLLALDLSAAARKVSDDVAEEFLRSHDLNLHYRLKQNRAGPLRGFLDCHRTGDLEGHFRGVHIVVGAVNQLNRNVDHRIAGFDPGGKRFDDAFFDRVDEFLGN